LASYGASPAEIAAVLDLAVDDLAAFAEDVRFGALICQCNVLGRMRESARRGNVRAIIHLSRKFGL
jgi:hypothetical protein